MSDHDKASDDGMPVKDSGCGVVSPEFIRKSVVEAIADAWASIDGKQQLFQGSRHNGDPDGYYQGYIADATELLKRIERRGYVVVPCDRRD